MKWFFALLLLLFSCSLAGHPWKSRHYVIIDTDCGLDDFRAIHLMLASPDIRVLAIITSNGVLDAKSGYDKVKSLLHELHQEGILVGVNNEPGIVTGSCLPARQMEWGEAGVIDTAPPVAIEVFQHILDNHKEPLTLVCLGSLQTARIASSSCQRFTSRVENIVWSERPDYPTDGFNYHLDPFSADHVISDQVPVSLIYGGSVTRYDDPWIKSLLDCASPAAHAIAKSTEPAISAYHRAFFDESVALYLHFPGLFRGDTTENLIHYGLPSSIRNSDLAQAYLSILSGESVGRNQVLSAFPIDTSFYQSDVQPLLATALKKYGKEEWLAGVMANEMHRHLGVYAIIGVKMGVRAREYFGAGIDEMRVISYAGLTPPFSCMNDGLQISTGATLGHGLISIAADTLTIPRADFIYMNQRIRVELKPEIRQKVESEIRELSKIYGLNNDIYWELVRNKAIKYWESFNRHEVFTIEPW